MTGYLEWEEKSEQKKMRFIFKSSFRCSLFPRTTSSHRCTLLRVGTSWEREAKKRRQSQNKEPKQKKTEVNSRNFNMADNRSRPPAPSVGDVRQRSAMAVTAAWGRNEVETRNEAFWRSVNIIDARTGRDATDTTYRAVSTAPSIGTTWKFVIEAASAAHQTYTIDIDSYKSNHLCWTTEEWEEVYLYMEK